MCKRRPRVRPRTIATLVVAAAVGAITIGSNLPTLLDTAEPSHPAALASGTPTGVDDIAETQPGRVPAYDRAAFGRAWQDTDRNGCDQRNDALRAAMRDVQFRPGTRGCVVAAGVLDDPYTGRTIDFTRGPTTSLAVQIDHIVPLAWAWRQGAAEWSDAQRLAFANDPANLQAVDGPANETKSDSGPAEWMPENTAYRCTYAKRFVTIVGTYGLTLDQPDRAVLTRTLATC